jgi:adenylate cyclase
LFISILAFAQSSRAPKLRMEQKGMEQQSRGVARLSHDNVTPLFSMGYRWRASLRYATYIMLNAMQEVEIRDQVGRIQRSEQFGNAPVLQRALSYMVEQVLDGRGAELKEIILALEVFNRGSDFDPRTDSSVRTQIGRLRQRLQSYYDGPGQGDAIMVTIPKGTYAPVFSSRGEAGTAVDARGRTSLLRASGRRYVWVLSAAALVALAGLVWMFWSRFRTEQVFSVAVLPFLDLTAEHNYDFFAEGMAEEIIDALVQNQSLRVIARTSSFRYKGKDLDIRRIGQELNVEAVIEGSVRRDGDRLRITVQLNRARDGSHVWSQTFDLAARDLLAVQREVSTSVARRLNAPQAAGSRVHPVDPDTYRMFLEARYLFNAASSPEKLLAAAETYRKAIARDDRYALAWAGLADACTYLAIYHVGGGDENYTKARDAAQKAVDLDPGLAEAHAALAGIALAHDWDFDRAEREAGEALRLSPGSSWTHHWMYHVHQVRGRLREAREELGRALSLDPTAVILLSDDAEFTLYRDEWDDAVRKSSRCLQLHPDAVGCALDRAIALFRKHDPAARRGLEANSQQLGSFMPLLDGFEALSAGNTQNVRAALERLSKDPTMNEPLLPATLYVLSGDWNSADRWLERCYKSRAPNMIFLHMVRDLTSDDPRYAAWLNRMHLPRLGPDK